MKENFEEIPEYNPFSNPTYMLESRNNNFLIDSVMEFLIFYIPFTLATVFLWNKVFYLLFNYEASKFLRPYSFWLIIADLLIQNNIQFFTFIGFRTILVFIQFNFATKTMNAFNVFFIFIIIVCVTCSYTFYYYKYEKLARYFLVNMYRFQSSYLLMIICYGVRPFLKGLMHAILYEYWELQIWSLVGV